MAQSKVSATQTASTASVSDDLDMKTTRSKLMRLAIPTFGQLIAEPLFILIDTAIIGHVSDSALAGLSLGSTIVLTSVGLCIFLAYSTTSQVARLFGAREERAGMEAGFAGLWLALLIGVVLSAFLMVAGPTIGALMGASGDVLTQAVIYMSWVAAGIPGMLLVYAATGILRGLQMNGRTFVAAAFGAALNTVLDIVFVWGFGWGIAGSGVATALAQWSMAVILLWPCVKGARARDVSMRPRMAGIKEAGREGSWLFVRTLSIRVALVTLVVAATALGAQVLAAFQIINALWNVAANALDAVAIAGQALVAREIGAKAYGHARQLTSFTGRNGCIWGIALGVVFIALVAGGGPLFTPNAEIQKIALWGMVIMAVCMPLQGWMWGLDGILIGAGDFKYLAATCAISTSLFVMSVVCAHVCFQVFGSVIPVVAGIGGITEFVIVLTLFNIFCMGGRGIANAQRARSDTWMHIHDN